MKGSTGVTSSHQRLKLKVTVRLSYNIAYCINPIWTFVSADIRKGEHNCVYEIYIHFTLMPVPVGRQGAVTFWEGNESHRRVSLPPGTRVEETWGFCCCCCFYIFLAGLHSMQHLSSPSRDRTPPRAGIEPTPLAFEAWSLNQWTTGEVPRRSVLSVAQRPRERIPVVFFFCFPGFTTVFPSS